MKVISIIQPWATLIALGEKKFETRSWATKYRGELAIHASKKVDKDAWMNEIIYMTLRKHGILTVNDLPTGAIIAICTLSECHEINVVGDTFAASINNVGEIVQEYEGNEMKFGWYEEGRFAWHMQHARIFEPIPAKGQLGLWNWEET